MSVLRRAAGVLATLLVVFGPLSGGCESVGARPDVNATVADLRAELATVRAGATSQAVPMQTPSATPTPEPAPTAEPTATLAPMIAMIDLVVPMWELGTGYGEMSSGVRDDDVRRRMGRRSIQIIASSQSGPLVDQYVACHRTADEARDDFEEDTTLLNGWTRTETDQAREYPDQLGKQPRWFPIASPLPGSRAFRRAERRLDDRTWGTIWLATVKGACVVQVQVSGYEGTRSQPAFEAASRIANLILARIPE